MWNFGIYIDNDNNNTFLNIFEASFPQKQE
jgi:hypothetical protein